MSTIPLKRMVELAAMKTAELFALAKQGCKLEAAVKKSGKEHKSAFKPLGKITAELMSRWNQGIVSGEIPATTSFESYHESNAGGKPNSHTLSCARAWSSFVVTKKVTEENYDSCSANVLEKASAIVTAVLKASGDLQHEAVTKAAAVLSRTDKDSAIAELKAILATVKPVAPLSQEDAEEMIDTLLKDGYLEVMAAASAAHVKYETDAAKRERAFFALGSAAESCGTQEEQDQWLTAAEEARQKAVKKVEFTGEPVAA